MKHTFIAVDMIACDGHGYCAGLLPERIALDDWGYPIMDDTPLTADLEENAKRAMQVCPVLALRLVDASRREAV